MSLVVRPVRDSAGTQILTDEILIGIWRRIVEQRRVEAVFYAGGVNTPAEFLEYILQPHVLCAVVCDAQTSEPRAIGWLTHAGAGSAFAHYCVLGRFRRDLGRTLLDYWFGLEAEAGEPLIEVLLGITPEIHTLALRVATMMGFTTIGSIPRYCRCPYAGMRCAGVLTCLERP